MDLFRAGEALLRSSQPLLPFLVPTLYRAPSARGIAAAPLTQHRRIRPHNGKSRPFSTTNPQWKPGETPGAAPQSQPATPAAPYSTIHDDVADILNSAPPPAASAHFPTSFRPRQQQASSSQGTLRDFGFRSGNTSLNDFVDSIGTPRAQSSPRSLTSSDINSILSPLSDGRNSALPPMIEEQEKMKLGSSVGRTVQVKDHDQARAFRHLDILCARNSVRRDFQRQRFHERPGLKRKRLKSERWRKNFKIQFKATIAMVQKMKRQGW